MQAPTLYFLNAVETITGHFEIWETHCGQEKGCFETDPQLVEFVRTSKRGCTLRDKAAYHGRMEEED